MFLDLKVRGKSIKCQKQGLLTQFKVFNLMGKMKIWVMMMKRKKKNLI